MTLPKSFTTVTTFSKILALVMFVTLPIVGFYLGIKYQNTLSSLQGADLRTRIFVTRQECESFTNRICVPTLCQSNPLHSSCKINNQTGYFATRVPIGTTPTPSPYLDNTSDTIEDFCNANNGTFLYELNETNKYMECENIDEQTCTSAGGEFNECASRCRHEKDDVYCIQVCVPVCSF